LIEFGLLVLKKIFKNCQCILLFPYYLLLEKGYPLLLKEIESLSPKDDLCQVWLNYSSGSGEEVENVKVFRRTDKRMLDNGVSEKLT
jgi:hypothetical protein